MNNKLYTYTNYWARILVFSLFVGLSSEIRFNAITDGFIVALSVLLMGIFVYCFADIKPWQFIFCCGIISPLIRFIDVIYKGGELVSSLIAVIPDSGFFMSFGIAYVLIYKYIVQEEKNMRNYATVVFCCDIIGNTTELFIRGLIKDSVLLTVENIGIIVAVALLRAILIQLVVIAVEKYSNILLEHEMDKEFKRLIIQRSRVKENMFIIEKNMKEMEAVMKSAYELYRELEIDPDTDEHYKYEALEISRLIHEIKGDYKGVAEVLKEQFNENIQSSSLMMSSILSLEKNDIDTIIKAENKSIEVVIKNKKDFPVIPYYEMISVIRNILVNSIESFEDEPGKIRLTTKLEKEDYIISIWDNGPGIPSDIKDSILLDGFSTKFHPETGNIQRGLGLPLVKNYVERFFEGKLDITSEEGKYTLVRIVIPKKVVDTWEKGSKDEILHN